MHEKPSLSSLPKRRSRGFRAKGKHATLARHPNLFQSHHKLPFPFVQCNSHLELKISSCALSLIYYCPDLIHHPPRVPTALLPCRQSPIPQVRPSNLSLLPRAQTKQAAHPSHSFPILIFRPVGMPQNAPRAHLHRPPPSHQSSSLTAWSQ